MLCTSGKTCSWVQYLQTQPKILLTQPNRTRGSTQPVIMSASGIMSDARFAHNGQK